MGKRKSTTAKKKQAKSATKVLSKSTNGKIGNAGKGFTLQAVKTANNPKAKKIDDEQKEFDRLQASLVEREMTVEWKRNKKSTRQSRRSKGKPTTSAKKLLDLTAQPATFAVKDSEKTTSQLVQEVVSKVQKLEGIGETRTMNSLGSAFLRPETPPAWSPEEVVQTSNPWAVLDDESSPPDRLPTTTPNCTPTSNFFQFAPASFSLGINVDPDL
jgi:hypothetical protein